MIRVKISRSIQAWALLLLLLGMSGSITSAQNPIDNGGVGGRPAFARDDNERSKSIFIHTLDAGQSVEDGVMVINNTDESKNVLVYATDSLVASGGAFTCEQFVDTADDVGSWIELEKTELKLDGSDSELVPFTIRVPEGIEPGEHDGCIVIQEAKDPTQVDQGIGLNFRTAIRVAILVPGDLARGDLAKNLAIVDIKARTISSSVVISPFIENSGNISIDSTIATKLRTLWGSDRSAVGGNYPVLRGQIGEWNFEHERPFWGGWYKTYASATYDSNVNNFIGDEPSEELLTEANGPIIFVWPHVLALLLYLLILIAIGYVLRRTHAKKKQNHLVAKTWKTHTIKQGEDLQYYAKHTNVSWKLIAKVNNVKAPYSLEPGQKIVLPPKIKK